jgi:hypothetical protein
MDLYPPILESTDLQQAAEINEIIIYEVFVCQNDKATHFYHRK